MLTFLKAQTSSLIASATDFVMTVLLVRLMGTSPALVAMASAEGAISGGIVNFVINRSWVFNGSGGREKTAAQAARYLMVWTGSVLLNAGGMYVFTYFTTINYAILKIFVSILVGVFYNYFLQKRFVFK